MQGNQEQFQLSSIDQALMDDLTNRVRECYQEMTRIGMQTINGHSLADTEFSRSLDEVLNDTQTHLNGTADPFHDAEICWPTGQNHVMCYQKGGGKIMIRLIG
ncbi:hypothetical protein SAMN05444487_10924 [Marininema mesophilum]|uniref:Uncharacterized protein n=1 Tax=Marininema mesophilum TaxID=1048340 RepID=A0A1H2YC32_9BACL|nr:hypothetical protein [Marininema mesophilum]SDX02783.1 hypothetical protein SAMN05444487_10924 [Marininema mesophilum]